MNWRSYTDNPVDEETRKKLVVYVNSKRRVDLNADYKDYLIKEISDKRVLDIGVAEHDLTHINAEGWKHEYISKNSSYCLGVDIIEPLVNLLKDKGYNIICLDATSDTDLKEKFDVVVIGDVIEHVENPVALLRFAKRHLADGGKIIVSTPNPFSYHFQWVILKEKTAVVNFEHTLWVSPSISVELAYRSGLELDSYHLLMKGTNFLKTIIKKIIPSELIARTIVYEFKHPITTKN